MKNIYIGMAVLAVGVVALIGFFAMKPGNQPFSPNDGQGQTKGGAPLNPAVNPTGSYSINELFAMNKPMKCTWKQSLEEGSDVANIVYMDGKKFYQDVTMGDVGHSFSISDGEYLYVWNDFTPAASKMKITEAEASPEAGQEAATADASMDQKRDFVCEVWKVDASVFNPPKDKEFKDVTAEMEQAAQQLQGGGTEDAKQQLCDMCRQAPTQELKDTCLANSQCN